MYCRKGGCQPCGSVGCNNVTALQGKQELGSLLEQIDYFYVYLQMGICE